MSYDIDILRLAVEKEKWQRFAPLIKKSNVSSVTNEIFSVTGDYWDNYPSHTTLDFDTLRTFFFICKGKKLKDPSAYEAAFDLLKKLTTMAPLEAIEKSLIEKDYAARIYDEVLGVSVGRTGTSLDNVRTFLDERDKEIGATLDRSKLFVSPSLGYLSSVVASKGLEWRLTEFNVSLGPLRKGDFVILAARPEAGKTTMIASEASHMMAQMAADEHILWINNEEASAKVMSRVVQAHHQVTTGDLFADISKYESSFHSAGGTRFLITDDTTRVTPAVVERMCKEFKPGLIIFDQLDKVQGFKNDRDDLRIGALYKWAREMAKEWCPVIAVSQLNGSAEGEKWVTMDHLRGSATDKPGEADAIIIIGDPRDGTLDRYISIAKNKLHGGPSSLEAHRHGKFQVTIEPSKARYVSHWRTK